MDAGHAHRIETGVDFAAAATFAAAAGYALVRLASSPPVVVAGAALAMLAGTRILSSIRPEPPMFGLASFDTVALPAPVIVDELLLTDADRLPAVEATEAQDELVLDEVVAKLEDFSRVVRLFDPASMPSPGELRNRIDRHLDGAAPPDASQALHDALADLRRTLR